MTKADLEEYGDTEDYSGEGCYEDSGPSSPVPKKRTLTYFSVQDRHEVSEFFYVPKSSHGGGVRPEPPPGFHSHPTSTHTLKAFMNSSVKSKPYDETMEPVQYTECVSVATIPAHIEESCVAYVDFESPKRCKEAVSFREVLSPDTFQSSIVCRTDCTKKNFKTTVDYVPKFKPRRFSETCYVLPKFVSHTYVAFMDYHVDEQRKWFTTTVELKPKTYSNTTIQNFEMQNDEPELVDSDGEEILLSDISDSEDSFQVGIANLNDFNDFNMNVVDKFEFKEGEPPHQESFRSHILVNGPRRASDDQSNVVNGYNGDTSEENGPHFRNDFAYDPRNMNGHISDESEDGLAGPGHFEDQTYHVTNGYENGYQSDEIEL